MEAPTQAESLTTAVPSIEAKADQLMAAIGEAHEAIDGVLGAEPVQDTTSPAGAEQQLDRCQAGMQALISRLNQVRSRVGRL